MTKENTSPSENEAIRFYVQSPHMSGGHAVIDRELSALVAVADLPAATTVANALNAAMDPAINELDRSDTYKMIHPALSWRVVEHLGLVARNQAK